MFPLYESEQYDRSQLETIRQRGKCQECGASLSLFWDPIKKKAFVACWDWPRSHHEGIEREASRYEQEGLAALNIPARREIMQKEFGMETSTKLAKYMGVTSLSRDDAKEILQAVFPDAPESDVKRAMILCANYQLNPLMKHLFLVPFNKKENGKVIGVDWAIIIGIKAKRLMASRRGPFSYIDDSPRLMSEAEEKKIYGKIDPGKIRAICVLKDPTTGAETRGYGWWPRNKAAYGEDKGNEPENMAFIRSESNALDRLRPGEMPENIEAMDEATAEGIIEGHYKVLDKNTDEISESKNGNGKEIPAEDTEHFCPVHNVAFIRRTGKGNTVFYSHKVSDEDGGGWCNEEKIKKQMESVPVAEQKQASEPVKSTSAPERDPDSIKTIPELQKALEIDFGLNDANQKAELNIKYWTDLAISPSEAYRRILAVRK